MSEVTLQMVVELLQQERQVSLKRLATLFAQPIQFESRRCNLQRFLISPQLNAKALWFPLAQKHHGTHKTTTLLSNFLQHVARVHFDDFDKAWKSYSNFVEVNLWNSAHCR